MFISYLYCTVKVSEYFKRFAANFLILLCVVNSQTLPKISDMDPEVNFALLYFNLCNNSYECYLVSTLTL